MKYKEEWVNDCFMLWLLVRNKDDEYDEENDDDKGQHNFCEDEE